MPTAASLTWSGKKLEPLYPGGKAVDVTIGASATIARGTVLGEKQGTNEVQSVTISGSPTAGTFTITYSGQTTAAIPYGATNAQIRNALEALSTVGDGNLDVNGGWDNTGGFWLLEFRGALGATDVAAVTASVASLTGGTPAVTIATVTTGAAGTTGVAAAYDNDNTDGTQTPKWIAMFDMKSDSSGKITLGDATPDEIGFGIQAAPVWMEGVFDTSELTGLDQVALDRANWSLRHGTIAAGAVRIG